MMYSRLHLRKIFALLAAILIFPALAYAGHDNDKGNNGENNGRGNDKKGQGSIPAVPEANTGIVLIPFVGAALLFSSLQLFACEGD
jgi:hypothetical protein